MKRIGRHSEQCDDSTRSNAGACGVATSAMDIARSNFRFVHDRPLRPTFYFVLMFGWFVGCTHTEAPQYSPAERSAQPIKIDRLATPEMESLAPMKTNDLFDDNLAASLDQSVVPTRRRLLAVLNEGPILFGLELVDGNESMEESWCTSAKSICRLLDENKDGRTTWSEVMKSELLESDPSQPNNRNNRQMVAAAYDQNGDRLADPFELVRFVNREDGGQSFMTIVRASSNRENSQAVFDWLDANDDLVLDADEILNCDHRLRMRDSDGDGRVFQNNFTFNNPSMLPNQMPTRPRPRTAKRLFVVKDNLDESGSAPSNWEEILYSMESAYSFGDELAVRDLPDKFRMLDSNDDGFIGPLELKNLASIPVDAILQVDFHDDEPPTLIVSTPISSPLSPTQFRPSRWQLSNGPFRFQVFCEDDLTKPPNASTESASEMPQALARLRLLVSLEDTKAELFFALDRDESGWLDSIELSRAKEWLQRKDANQDGQIELKELVAGVRLTIRRAPASAEATPSARMATAAKSVEPKGPNWFVQMDTNRDGFVEQIEFLGSLKKFAELDTSGDKRISVDEVLKMER